MKNILVVEDDPAILETLVEILEFEGYGCFGATEGLEGLQRAVELRPDLILMDLMMPVMDGREALKQMRLHPVLSTTPVILMSAAPQGAALARSPEHALFLRKPFELEELLGAVESLIGSARRGARREG